MRPQFRLAILAGVLAASTAMTATAIALEAGVRQADATAAPQQPKFVWGVAQRNAGQAARAQGWDDAFTLATSGSGSGGASIFTSGATGAGVILSVVDTGVDLTHPEFAGRILAGKCYGSCPTGAGADDNNGHGSHVAGIAAGGDDGFGITGVAPEASILPVKVLGAGGSGSLTDVANGVAWAGQNGADVINLSLGATTGSTALKNALASVKANTVIIAAAGNGGTRRRPAYPAAYATDSSIVGSMLIVGSVDANNTISSFSQTPANAGCVTTNSKRYCYKDFFVVAPGRSIYSAYKDGGYKTLSGTSMATPFVAGTAALILSESPFLTPSEVVEIIKLSATDLGAPGVDGTYGWGLVNPGAALAPVGPTSVATSGGLTASYSGTGAINSSALSAPWAAAIRNSALLKSVTFFDGFGRDYKADLTAAVADGRVSFIDTAFATFGQTNTAITATAGDLSFAGIRATADANPVEQLGLARSDEGTQIIDAVVAYRLSEEETLTFGYNARMAGRLNALDLASSAAYDGLFTDATALNSPYLSLTDGGEFSSYTTEIAQGVTFSAGYAQADNTRDPLADGSYSFAERAADLRRDFSHDRQATNTMAALSYGFAPWGMVGIVSSLTEEENGLLGSREGGALALTGEARTISTGVAARLSLGEGWIASASWAAGVTEVSPEAHSLFAHVSTIESQSYGIALSKLGIFGDTDSIGFAVSRPLHVTRGEAIVRGSVDATEAREIVYASERLNLATPTPETLYEAGYTTPLGEGVALSATAIYQQNADGEAGRDAAGAMLRLRIAF